MATVTDSTTSTYDYSMLGSFSEGGASALNGDLITKLREAEEKARVTPIETRLETWDTEAEKIAGITVKVDELLASVKPFDLFSTEANAFEQISATTTGDSALFDAIDVGGLKEGSYTVSISQLAQKDVYQTIAFADSTSLITGGQDVGDKLTIEIGGVSYDFSTEGKTYDDLASDINLNEGINASVEQVSDTEYRIVIKSIESGMESALTITEVGIDLDTDEILNHTLSAQNLNATVDGVLYDVSSNSITVDGNIKITATKIGDTSLSIQRDDSSIIPAIEDITTKYNELVALVNEELYATDSSIQDKSGLKSMMNGIKEKLFALYGDDDKSIFNYGFSFDADGYINIDSTVLGEALTNNFEDVKSLFLGVAEDKGLGTQLKEYMDDLNAYNGIFALYEENMNERKTNLEEEKEKAIKELDTKYDLMASQFAAYGAIISQMEASFGGLKQMIAESTSSN